MKQRMMKPGHETGSFINMLMSSNSSIPEVGKGATVLSWTDRHAYEVMSVSEDKKRVVIQQYHPERIDSNGMSESQKYKYEKLNGVNETIVWRNGAWRKVVEEVVFTQEGLDLPQEERMKLFNGDVFLQLCSPYTRVRTTYPKINIIFGVKEEYYDYSF